MWRLRFAQPPTRRSSSRPADQQTSRPWSLCRGDKIRRVGWRLVLMAKLTAAHEAELHDRGWTVIEAFTDACTTRAARALTDALLGGPPPVEAVAGGVGQNGPWPADDDARPVVQSAGWRHGIMHPMPDASGVLASLIPPMADLYARLLRCGPTELKLLKQQLVRVDATTISGDGGPSKAHMDQAFLLRHRTTTPLQIYYHTMLALSDVVSGGAPFLARKGGFRHSLDKVASLSEEEQDLFEAAYSQHADTSAEALYAPLLAQGEWEEVLLREGDLLVQDPMLLHSASSNAGAVPARYTLFTTMFHPDACKSTVVTSAQASRAPCSKFPRELRLKLSPRWRPLLEWTLSDRRTTAEMVAASNQQDHDAVAVHAGTLGCRRGDVGKTKL